MVAANQCPDENALLAWALGHSSTEEQERVARHVDVCQSCQRAFACAVGSQETMKGGSSKSPPTYQPGVVLLDKYEVEEVLGEGGMGTVVRALHRGLHERVALKFIKAEHAGNQDIISRFSREARAASKLRSPHCCRIMDFGTLPDGAPFMVMEYLEGESLEARLRRTGRLSVEEALRWTGETLEGLAEAHDLGIVHRDIKPANLFIQRTSQGERLKILDFGIAKSAHPEIELGLQQTSHAMLVGSPAFMAPEQFTAGATVDVRTDIWAVGCTLFAMLTGVTPFVGRDLGELSRKVREEPAPAMPRVPPTVVAFVNRCIEKQPKARFQSVSEVKTALHKVQHPSRSRAGLWLGGAALTVILGSIGGLTYLERIPAAPVRDEPQAPTPVAIPTPAAPPEAPLPEAKTVEEAQPVLTETAPVAKSVRRKEKVSKPAPRDAGQATDVFGERL